MHNKVKPNAHLIQTKVKAKLGMIFFNIKSNIYLFHFKGKLLARLTNTKDKPNVHQMYYKIKPETDL
jgi:hypothetical protein